VVRSYSAREFNRDTAGAKRAAEDGPVYVTDRGRPSHVLLSIAEYERLVAAGAAAAGDPARGSASRPPTLLDLLGSGAGGGRRPPARALRRRAGSRRPR